MILLLDFDRTLFDTDNFKRLLRFETVDNKPALEQLWGIIRLSGSSFDLTPFVFGDTIDFLKAHEHTYQVLLTHGNRIFQYLKVRKSGLWEYFDERIFTGKKMKGECAQRRFEETKDTVVFLDDSIPQLQSMRKKCPHIISIRMKRTDGASCDEPTPPWCHEVSDMVQFAKLLKTI